MRGGQRMQRAITSRVFLALVLLLTAGTVQAVIKSLVPLKTYLVGAKHICVAKVDSLAPDRPGMVLTVESDLKGKLPVRRLPINMTGDKEAKEAGDSVKMFKRLAKDLPVVLFVVERPEGLSTFGYTNGTWFQMLGQKDGDSYRWSFLHCEPYLRCTFKGTTTQLQQSIKDFLDKKKEPPPPNKDEKPGLGPELKQASGGRKPPVGSDQQGAYAPRSPLFGVIVGLPAGGVIGFLAL